MNSRNFLVVDELIVASLQYSDQWTNDEYTRRDESFSFVNVCHPSLYDDSRRSSVIGRCFARHGLVDLNVNDESSVGMGSKGKNAQRRRRRAANELQSITEMA